MVPTLRKGTVLQVCKPFDPVMVELGDRGILTGKGRLHIYIIKPSHGALPLYDFDVGLVENGTFRIVEEVTHDITDEEMEGACKRMEDYQAPRADAYYKELDLIFIKLDDLNLHRRKDRDSLDNRVFQLLLRKGAKSIRDIACEYTSHHNYRNRYDLIEASAQRLIVAGKILPVTENGHLIPCH